MKIVSIAAINSCAARMAIEIGKPAGEVADKLIVAHEKLGIKVAPPSHDTELDFASRKTLPHRTPQAWPLQPS